MRNRVATTLIGLALAVTGVLAQQPPGRAPLNLGVPVQPCEREDARAKAAGWNLAFGLGVHRACQPHVVAPRLIKQVRPQYTPEAMGARIQGTVVLGAVIGRDGLVQEVRVLQSLDTVFGLDDAAVDAVRRSTFEPGRLDMQAVPVLVIFEQQFTIR